MNITNLAPIYDELLCAGATDVCVVGGAVRDHFLGIECLDIDTEVYGLTAAQLVETLRMFGKVSLVGESFQVYRLSYNNCIYDFSLPRRERSCGPSHKDFITEEDSDMTYKEAASRRDFTMNAIMYSYKSKTFIDLYDGIRDMKYGILRRVGPSFAEDPLRVLRGMQFCGRFNLRPDMGTLATCRNLVPQYFTLSLERIWGEWYKWASMSTAPSSGIWFLRETGWLQFYPVLNDIWGVKQNPSYHPEGTVWDHTLDVIDRMIPLTNNLSESDRAILILAALLHDVGKSSTTAVGEDGQIHSYDHAKVGKELAVNFLTSIGAPSLYLETIPNLVAEHMFFQETFTMSAVRRLAKRLYPATISQLCTLITADKGIPTIGLLSMAEAERIQDNAPKPLLMGRHLIEQGMQPGPEMGKILRAAYEAQLEGEFTDLCEAIEWSLSKI